MTKYVRDTLEPRPESAAERRECARRGFGRIHDQLHMTHVYYGKNAQGEKVFLGEIPHEAFIDGGEGVRAVVGMIRNGMA